MGIDDTNLTSNDPNFLAGQKADAFNLGDKGTGTGKDFVPDWDPAFLQQIHGVILISGDSHGTVNKKLHQIKQLFHIESSHPSIKEVTSIVGDVRPGKQSAHEQ